MSSTNPKTRGGDGFDDFPTPPWAVQRLLEADPFARFDQGKRLSPGSGDWAGRWLEPCAGAGNIIHATHEHWRAHDGWRGETGPEWTACEIQPKYKNPLISSMGTDQRVIIGDFLSLGGRALFDNLEGFDVAITNPPFSLAFNVLKRCRKLSRCVVLLLRVGFLEASGASPKTVERDKFLRQDWPDIAILPNRPPFARSKTTGKVHTDSATYCWAIWGPEPRDVGASYRLGSTPKGVRKAWIDKLNEEQPE